MARTANCAWSTPVGSGPNQASSVEGTCVVWTRVPLGVIPLKYSTWSPGAVPSAPANKCSSVTSGSNLPEALQITVALGDLYVQAELDGTLAGTNQLVTGAFTVDAYRSGLPDAVFNVKFNPPVIDDTVNSFAFVGTWANYREPNCKAAVRGKFTKRP